MDRARTSVAPRPVFTALLIVIMLGVALSTNADNAGAYPPQSGVRQSSKSADLILRNGVVFTVDRVPSWAQAVAVAHGKFVYVGSDAKVDAFVGPRTRVIDLQGKMLLPGIIDSHIHPDVGEFYNHRLCNVQSFTLDEGYS